MQPDDYYYEAERLVHVMRYPERLQPETVQDYYDHVVATRFVQNAWPALPKKRIKVIPTKHAHAWADGPNRSIYLPAWSCNDFTLLHEIAHFAVGVAKGHEEAFTRAHLALVKRFMGDDAGRCFRHALIATGKL